MYENFILTRSFNQIRELFKEELPRIYDLAEMSESSAEFKKLLIIYVSNRFTTNLDYDNTDRKSHLLRLIDRDGDRIFELSTEKEISIDTITYLWKFLRNESELRSIDFATDLFYQFRSLDYPKPKYSDKQIKSWMRRWPSGTNEKILIARKENKSKIIDLLIDKIENKKGDNRSKYEFPTNLNIQQKRDYVIRWWDDYKFHLAMAIKDPDELNLFLNNTISLYRMNVLYKAKTKGIPFFITPYYIHLMNTNIGGFNDYALRSYVLYSSDLVDTFGNIMAWEKEDKVEYGKPNAAGWLLPEGHNIHRRYPEVAIMIPDSMGRACGGLCASCQRMYDFQSKRLNFDLDKLKPKESWTLKLQRLMEYYEKDTQLRDILITGGDALMSQNKTIKSILNEVYKMAIRKKEANISRVNGEKYAEIQRVRLGSRLLAYLPMRIDEELIQILKEFREKAVKIGIKQFILQTHYQTPLEMSEESLKAVKMIQSAGWVITNQLVFNVAASRRGHTAKLRWVLNKHGIIGYYTFTVKGFTENYSVYAPNARSIQEEVEEKVLGKIDINLQNELMAIVRGARGQKGTGELLLKFMDKNKLPFVATDRNVLNLPGIGKSMTFEMVGITKEGKRILKFKHDNTRIHSPNVQNMGDVYIVVNKSIRSYLLQLKEAGEKMEEYSSIWYYTEGITEKRFPLYDYPRYKYELTKKITNIL